MGLALQSALANVKERSLTDTFPRPRRARRGTYSIVGLEFWAGLSLHAHLPPATAPAAADVGRRLGLG
jgi:hypothetical protein